ncbi:MAG: hypothetical protein JKY11_01200 [Alphaproteobacteria bacterium]|nr:hypothetical protein [Alphaproteobacteria bacterium]
MTDETADLDDEPVKKKKKKRKKRKPINKKKVGFWSFAVLIGLMYYWGTMPIYIQGSQLFGVCRVYIELNVQYPSELRFVDIRERGAEVTVEYITYDSFGQHIAHRAVCQYKRDENQQIVLDYFRLKRGTNDRDFLFAMEDPERVASFNKTVPFLSQQPLNLIIRGPARTLGSLSPAN